MIRIDGFPASEKPLRDEIVRKTVRRLEASYHDSDRAEIQIPAFPVPSDFSRFGDGTSDWESLERLLFAMQELVMPGTFTGSMDVGGRPLALLPGVEQLTDHLHSILAAYFILGYSESAGSRLAAHAALNLIAGLPEIRSRAHWNIFASLKDPAVWDSYLLTRVKDRATLAQLDLIPEIDETIRRRDRGYYLNVLSEYGLDFAYEYQIRLVKRAYPSWRALLLHDVAHTLATGKNALEEGIEPSPCPILPRVIGEHAAHMFQSDLHPECVIGDANFLDHTHRGITTGQTGRIGVGCVIYPCTLGGVTDKVKQRHPLIGDFVLIGTDVGIFGPVSVGEGSVVGPNTEINGFVAIGKNVKIRAAVVARTVISGSGRPGRLVFEDDVVVGEESLILNDHPTDLVIPAGTVIPPNSFIINEGNGKPRQSHAQKPPA